MTITKALKAVPIALALTLAGCGSSFDAEDALYSAELGALDFYLDSAWDDLSYQSRNEICRTWVRSPEDRDYFIYEQFMPNYNPDYSREHLTYEDVAEGARDHITEKCGSG